MTQAFEPGNSHARHTDPITSKIAGRSDFTSKKERTCLLIACFDTEAGLTRAEVKRISERPDIIRLLGHEPLGDCPWHRVTDCINEHWVRVLKEDNGEDMIRPEAKGKPQQVFRITDAGRAKASQIAQTLRG